MYNATDMMKKLLLAILLSFVFTPSIYAVRSLPQGTQPKSLEGEAVGNIPQLKGTGTLTFINTGGDARLVAVCGDLSEERARVNSLTCEGIDVTGTFTGGPNGIAVFNTESGEIKLQLTDGKVFSFSTQGFSMDFTVTDPSIFDEWTENSGARDSGARLSDISGQVEIACPPDLDAWDVMKMGRVIYVDCHLKTGEDSSAVISFSDMTTFEMKSESEIVIDTPPEKESKWSLIAGNIWVNVKQMVKDGTMKVHMSQAVAGIKGTTFILNETKTESTIKVIEGSVSFDSKNTKDTAQVNAGESVTGTKTGLSAKTNFDVSSEIKNWQASINSTKKKTDAKKLNSQTKISTTQITSELNKKTLYILGGAVGLIILISFSFFFLITRKHVK
jgi:hypothetical protein